MTSSPETTSRTAQTRQSDSGADIRARADSHPTSSVSSVDLSLHVASIAGEAESQTDFLQRVAKDLAVIFEVDVVAISHPIWDTPMMLVSGTKLAAQLDGQVIAGLLEHTGVAPTACDVPLRNAASVKENTATDLNPIDVHPDRTRALHVGLTEDNSNGSKKAAAVILLYAPDSPPTTVRQFHDLKQLGQYANHCRDQLSRLDQVSTGSKRRFSDPAVDDSFAQQPAGELAITQHARSMRHFHHDLDLTATAFRIANETRRVLSLDRTTVLLARRGHLKVEAVSGVAVVDRRANSIATAEEFVQRVVVLGRPMVLPCEDPLPPQIQQPLDDYLDESDVASVAVIPLYRHSDQITDDLPSADSGRMNASLYTEDHSVDAEPIGVLLLESFSNHPLQAISPLMTEVGAEAAIAISNSMEHHRVFGLRTLKAVGDAIGGRRLPYTMMGLFASAGLLLASLIIRVDHKVIATGIAEPVQQQNVFARSDGIVKEILVADGESVSKGQALMRLENADLETSLETLTGEVQTTSQRLSSIRAMLLDPSTDTKQSSRMAIEQRQLQSELSGLQSQLKLVKDQIAQLDIRSPINGVVAAWQLKRKLADRPVSRGNHLMAVIEEDGPWQLRLEIPDPDAAEVLEVMKSGSEVTVEFAAASRPRSTYHAKLGSIATAARRNAAGSNVVDALATIVPGDESISEQAFGRNQARVGVETTAKITCGRRSLLGSWFGDVADFVNRNILFYIR